MSTEHFTRAQMREVRRPLQRIEWDADEMRATNCPEADRFLRKEYRRGFELPRS